MSPKSLWLARLLYRHNGLTKQEILDAWRDEDDRGRPMAASTFYDNRRYLEARYGLHIECRGGRYALSREQAAGDTILRHLLGMPAVDGAEADAPAGAHWIPLLSESLEWNRRLLMEYVPLDKPSYETFFEPYCLRQIRGCLYAVGRSSRHAEVRNFAVDRIGSLQLLPMRFKPAADFRAEAWFAHSFGAFGGPDVHPEHVVIAASSRRMAAYLRSRPLHASQRESADGDGARFELDVAPTRDFLGQLLSFGTDVRVLSPESLRQKLLEEAQGIVEKNR